MQCSIPFLAFVACAEFTGLCIIGCFHQRGSNYTSSDLVTDELCTWASLGLMGLYFTAWFSLGSMKTQIYTPCTSSWWLVRKMFAFLHSWNLQKSVLYLAFYYCLPTSSTSLSHLEAASVMPDLWMFFLQIFFSKVSLRVLSFFCEWGAGKGKEQNCIVYWGMHFFVIEKNSLSCWGGGCLEQCCLRWSFLALPGSEILNLRTWHWSVRNVWMLWRLIANLSLTLSLNTHGS